MLSNGSCLTGRNLSHGADDFRTRIGGASAISDNDLHSDHHHIRHLMALPNLKAESVDTSSAAHICGKGCEEGKEQRM